MGNQRYGYMRVGSPYRDHALHIEHFKFDQLFIDNRSEKTVPSYPELEKLFSIVQAGDTVVVPGLIQMADNLDDLRNQLRRFVNRGVLVEFLKEKFTVDSAGTDRTELFMTLMDAFVEFERNLLDERQTVEFALANYDGLTGLPNRNLLQDRLKQALLHADRYRKQTAVLFVDLDHFKVINDSLGHDIGDLLLKIIADRLKSCVRSEDTVSYQGGDDFILVLSDLVKSEDAAKVAQKILTTVNKPVTINEHDLEVSCSIGISLYPKDGKDVQTLLKNGDAAMFLAKEHGRNAFQFFTEELNERVVARMTIEKSLRRALENDELSLHYQPQVSLMSGAVIGAEALLRWNCPDLGMVGPSQFIPLAEETGLIIPIGEWVLRTACRQNKEWQIDGLRPFTMAINLSPRQFLHSNLFDSVSKVLDDSSLDPQYLELEITEGIVMRDVEKAIAMMSALKKFGVKLSMDDFGTGYSSLSYLNRFPFDKLKMDISFVRDVTSNPGSAAIARTIIAMGHHLNLRVIAEGIETEGQLNYLRMHGCDEMQGFLFSRPLPPEKFRSLLRDNAQLTLSSEKDGRPRRTLLVVDDDPHVILAIQRVLRKEGYTILTASDAIQGFELLAQYPAGVVLSDHQMPQMTGVEFLGRVKFLHPDTVRIAMSGHEDMAMLASAINQGGIYKFLTKPVDTEVLRQCISNAFEHYESKRGRKDLP